MLSTTMDMAENVFLVYHTINSIASAPPLPILSVLHKYFASYRKSQCTYKCTSEKICVHYNIFSPVNFLPPPPPPRVSAPNNDNQENANRRQKKVKPTLTPSIFIDMAHTLDNQQPRRSVLGDRWIGRNHGGRSYESHEKCADHLAVGDLVKFKVWVMEGGRRKIQ
jgi:hypothetical protein